MKYRIIGPIALFVTLLFVAFSTGSPIFFLLAVLIMLTLITGYISVVTASQSLQITTSISAETLHKGDNVILTIHVKFGVILPVGPLIIHVCAGPGQPVREMHLNNLSGVTQELQLPFYASHIGVSNPGIQSYTVQDLLGCFAKSVQLNASLCTLVVLPSTFEVSPVKLAPGDPGSETMALASEDLSEPSDIRTYQPGDAMKKIHWKLSLRRGDLLVRKYDEPVLPDVLILLDCSKPPSWGQAEAEADTRDALIETTASVLEMLMREGRELRLPLFGKEPLDITRAMGYDIAVDHLSRVEFSEADRFDRVLMMETGRLRKIGCTVIIAARLSSAMVDVMISMHRMGPNIRLYLITFVPDDENILSLVARLNRFGIEVSYVTPQRA